jgi:hypothetical protein
MYLLNGIKIDPSQQIALPDGGAASPGFFNSPDARAAYGIVEAPDPVWPDSRYYMTTANPDGSLTSLPREVVLIRQDMQNRLAEIRYQRETAGITMPDGFLIRTDRESQFQILGVSLSFQAGVITSTQFKGLNEWKIIDAAYAGSVTKAVTDYVQACFANEKSISDSIAAADFGGLQSINLDAGWPAQQVSA